MEAPKYVIVQDWLKNEINCGTYPNGSKLPSENELMERFGFSRQTIRLAIANLENMGYVEKVKGSGTYVNLSSQQEPTQEVKNIGVILRHLDYYIYPEVVKGIEQTLMQNGYTMTLGISHNEPEKEMAQLNSLLEKNIDGLIAEPLKTTMPMPVKETYQAIAGELPVVFLGGTYRDMQVPVVTMDYKDAAYRATKYLMDMGHKNIGAVLRSDEVGGHSRYEGYVAALMEKGITPGDKNIIWYTSDIKEAMFSVIFKQNYFQGMHRATALLCQNDKSAEVCVECLRALNVRPFEDVSIISFDNSKTAEMLGLTTMEHAKSQLGAKAAETLIRLIKTKTAESTYIKSNLVVRSSVRKRSFTNSWDSQEDFTQ